MDVGVYVPLRLGTLLRVPQVFGIIGASQMAYQDPMYADYYGDDMMDGGFDADGGGDFDDFG